MDATVDPAAVVSVLDDRLLVIRRTKHGRRYAVLPSGSVERNESAQEAALRELREETSLLGELREHLWTLEHNDRVADYFLVAVPASQMAMSGPESSRETSENTYEPCWIRIADLDAENLQPEALRPLICALAGVL